MVGISRQSIPIRGFMKKIKVVYVTNQWTFKPHTRELIFEGKKQATQLPNMVSGLLEILCQNQGKFVDRNELFDLLWEGNYAVGDRGLRQVVFQLRKALSSVDNDTPVINIPRKGYKLVADVEERPFFYPFQSTYKVTHVVVIATMIILGLLFLMSEDSEPITVDGAPVTTESGLEEAFAISPDGKSLLYNKMVDGEFKIYQRDLTQAVPDELFVSGPGNMGGMVWNHVGDKVAYLQNTGERYVSDIYIHDLNTGKSQLIAKQVTFNIGQSPNGIAWSPLEDKLAFTSPSSNNRLALYVYDAQTAITQQLTTPHYIDAFPQWSPDGKLITFNSLDMNYRSELHAIDCLSGKVSNLTPSGVKLFGHTWIDAEHVIFSTQENGAFVGKLLHVASKSITAIKTAGNFQFPQKSNSDIYYLRTNQELQLRTYQLKNNALSFAGLVDSIGDDVMPVIHGTSEKLVFVSDRTGKQELWFQKNLSTQPIQITFKNSVVSDPSFSQSGRSVLYHWFNEDINAYQLGVYDLERRQEIPIDLTTSRKAVFAGGESLIAYLQVTEHSRQLWIYDTAQNLKQMIKNDVIHILGSDTEKHEVYFDQHNALYRHNILTHETQKLTTLDALSFPYLIHGGSIYYQTFMAGSSHVVKYDFSTGEEQLIFSVAAEYADQLHSFAIGHHEQKVVLNLYSKNEGDIYKFPVVALSD